MIHISLFATVASIYIFDFPKGLAYATFTALCVIFILWQLVTEMEYEHKKIVKRIIVECGICLFICLMIIKFIFPLLGIYYVPLAWRLYA